MKMKKTLAFTTIRRAATSLALGALLCGTAAAQVATENRSPGGISWDVHVSYDRVLLVVAGSSGEVFRREYSSDPVYELVNESNYVLGDGQYNYELRMLPNVSAGQLQQLDALRAAGDEAAFQEMMEELGLDETPTFSGIFTVAGGSLVLNYSEGPQADIIHSDDVIVNGGSVCIGFDCVNGESFGFDALRLKENNLRLHFDDTSNTASFPQNDWRLVANDTSNGGGNYFAIEDSTAGRVPFRVEAGAPPNPLYIEDDGDVGIGTSTPVVEIHNVDGDTPTLRLEQDGSSGFTPQSWDVAGNETNFFVRDVTNGSKLPFKIIPNTVDNTLALNGERVGMGTRDPVVDLEIRKGHNIQIAMNATQSGGAEWRLQNLNGTFRLSKSGSGTNEFLLAGGGNLTIAGTLTEGSSRAIKNVYPDVDGGSVLARLGELPISEWSYKTDGDVRHLGPMAEDFYRLFGFGPDAEHLAARDLAAVSVVAVQELHKKLADKEDVIARLEERLERLEAAIGERR